MLSPKVNPPLLTRKLKRNPDELEEIEEHPERRRNVGWRRSDELRGVLRG